MSSEQKSEHDTQPGTTEEPADIAAEEATTAEEEKRASPSNERSPSPIHEGESSKAESTHPDARSPSPEADDVQDDHRMLLRFIVRGDLDGVKSILPTDGVRNKVLFEHIHHRKGKCAIPGNIVFHAAYLSLHNILSYMATCEGYNQREHEVMFHMQTFQRFPTAIHLLSLETEPGAVNQQREDSGDTLLHIACSRKRPNYEFIRALCHLPGIDVNVKNDKGLTPLHLLAKYSTSAESRLVARCLLHFGARDTILTKKGETASQLAQNPFVREVLQVSGGLGGGPRSRDIPPLDDKSKDEIDRCPDLVRLPSLRIIDTTDGATEGVARHLASEHHDNSAFTHALILSAILPNLKKSKKISADGVESMVTRLYTQSIEQKKTKQQRALENLPSPKTKQLSAEEAEEAVERLYKTAVEASTVKKEQVAEKYLEQSRVEPLRKPVDEIQDACQRLSRSSDEHTAKQKALEEKYCSPRKSKKISKGKTEELASRLHDDCMNHYNSTMGKLHTQYASKHKSRFCGETKLGSDGWKSLGERLCTKK